MVLSWGTGRKQCETMSLHSRICEPKSSACLSPARITTAPASNLWCSSKNYLHILVKSSNYRGEHYKILKPTSSKMILQKVHIQMHSHSHQIWRSVESKSSKSCTICIQHQQLGAQNIPLTNISAWELTQPVDPHTFQEGCSLRHGSGEQKKTRYLEIFFIDWHWAAVWIFWAEWLCPTKSIYLHSMDATKTSRFVQHPLAKWIWRGSTIVCRSIFRVNYITRADSWCIGRPSHLIDDDHSDRRWSWPYTRQLSQEFQEMNVMSTRSPG